MCRTSLSVGIDVICLLTLSGLPGEGLAATKTHGPVVGGVTATEAVLWVRTGQPASVAFMYARTSNLSGAESSVSVKTRSADDFTAKVTLTGLLPNTTYYYTPRVDGREVMMANYPSFTTAPLPGTVSPFTFLVLTDFQRATSTADTPRTFASAGAEGAAFAIIGGDFDHRNPGSGTTDLKTIRHNTRLMHRENYNRTLPRRRDLVDHILRRGGIVHLWGDHDYCCNDADGLYVGKAVALDVYDEYFPSYPRPLSSEGIFQSWKWGHVEFFLIDARSHRSPSVAPDNDQKTMLGATQKTWLKQALVNSSATWKILLTDSVFNPTVKCGADNWCDYRTEGKELTDFIRSQGIQNVVILSGDIHAGAITDGQNSVYDTFWEMAVPGADVNSCDTTTFQGPDKFGEWTHGTWGVGFRTMSPPKRCWGYGVVNVLTDPHRLELAVKDDNGTMKLMAVVMAGSGQDD